MPEATQTPDPEALAAGPLVSIFPPPESSRPDQARAQTSAAASTSPPRWDLTPENFPLWLEPSVVEALMQVERGNGWPTPSDAVEVRQVDPLHTYGLLPTEAFDPAPNMTVVRRRVTRFEVVRGALRARAHRDVLASLGYRAETSYDYERYAGRMLDSTGIQMVRTVALDAHPVEGDPHMYAEREGFFSKGVTGEMLQRHGHDARQQWRRCGGLRFTQVEGAGWTFHLPWWTIEPIEETPEQRLERLRATAKERLYAKLRRWDGRFARPYTRVATFNERHARHAGDPARQKVLEKGRLFEWAREQKDWPLLAVYNVLAENYSTKSLRDAIRRYVKRTKAYSWSEWGVAWFYGVWTEKMTHEEQLKQEHSAPWQYPCKPGRPWTMETWSIISASLHAPAPSKEDPLKLAYYQTYDKFKRGIRTVIKPGKYLKKYFGIGSPTAILPVLNDDQIRAWAEKWENTYRPVPVHFKENTDPDGWTWVFSNERGFDSCMSAGRYSCLGPQAVRAYARPGNGLRLAYTTDDGTPDGQVTARTVVNWDRKQRARVYGDPRIDLVLQTMGVEPVANALSDVLINAIESNEEHFYLPYIDAGTESGGGALYVRPEDTPEGLALLTCTEGSVQANLYDTAQVPKHRLGLPGDKRSSPVRVASEDDDDDDGYYEDDDDDDDDDRYETCGNCGGDYPREDMTWSGRHEIDVCPNCIGEDEDFVLAYTSSARRRSGTDLVDRSETVCVDGVFYLDDDDVLTVNDLGRCAMTYEVMHMDELVSVPGTDGLVDIRLTSMLDIPHTDGYGDEHTRALTADTTLSADGRRLYDEDIHLDDVTGDYYHEKCFYRLVVDVVHPSGDTMGFVAMHHTTLSNTALWVEEFSVQRVSETEERLISGLIEGVPTLAERVSSGVPFVELTGLSIEPPEYDAELMYDDEADLFNKLFNLTAEAVAPTNTYTIAA